MSQEQEQEQEQYTVTLKLENGDQIMFINGNTGLESIRVISEDSISLSKGFVYVLPINEENLNLKDHYVIKENPRLSSKILVRNVEDGKITIYPIVNGVVLSNSDFMGTLI